jgi:hypothetical protein
MRPRRPGSVDFLESDELFFTYQLAEQSQRTVQELLTGEKGPLSLSEFFMWHTYFKVKSLYQKQANKQQ